MIFHLYQSLSVGSEIEDGSQRIGLTFRIDEMSFELLVEAFSKSNTTPISMGRPRHCTEVCYSLTNRILSDVSLSI